MAGALALGVPLAVLPAGDAAATDAAPWWCAPDAVLTVSRLPDVLPASTCALDGRAVAGDLGFGAEVPPVGHGVAASAYGTASETVTVWTDEYGVHVRGDQYTAAYGYLGALRAYLATGAGEVADARAMAGAVRRLTGASVGRVRPLPFRVATLLDAADTLAAAVPADPGATGAALAAADLLAAYFRLQTAPGAGDGLPSVGDLRAMAAGLRAALGEPVDATAADGLLADALMLRNYVRDEAEIAAYAPALDALVLDLRVAAGVGVHEPIDYDHGETLGAVERYLADTTGVETSPLPWAEPTFGDPSSGVMSSASPPACSDGARGPLYADRSKWTPGARIKWYYSNIERYPFYGAAEYRDAVIAAFDNVTNLHTDCGYGWSPNITNAYQGYATQRGPNVTSADKCGTSDGYSVVGWKSFSSSWDGVLAFACVWRAATTIKRVDVALNNTKRWDIPEVNWMYGKRCSEVWPGDWDVEAVMTHEFGHGVGLGHVSEESHGNLTMSKLVNAPCAFPERTLGYGDALGLASFYGRVS